MIDGAAVAVATGGGNGGGGGRGDWLCLAVANQRRGGWSRDRTPARFELR